MVFVIQFGKQVSKYELWLESMQSSAELDYDYDVVGCFPTTSNFVQSNSALRTPHN